MKKFILALAFSLPLLGLSQTLTNKTFDTDITGWINNTVGSGTASWDSTNGANAAGSLKWVTTAASQMIQTQTPNTAPFAGAGTYTLTFKVKGPAGATVKGVTWQTGNQITGSALTLTGGWDTYTSTHVISSTYASSIMSIRLQPGVAGTFYFDDVDWTYQIPAGNTVLNTTVSGPGTLAKSPASYSYAPTDGVTLTATPKSHAVFTGWSGDLTGTTNPATFTMNTNKSVTANFAADPTFNYAYYFNTDGDLEGWDKTTDASLTVAQAGGIVTLTPTANQYTRFSLTGFPIPTGTYNKVTVKLKNLSATTNLIGITLNNGGSDVNIASPITTSDTAYKTYTLYFDSSTTGLSGNLTNFRIKFADSNNTTYSGRPSDNGQILIDEIIFENAATTWNGSGWSNGVPTSSLYANIAGNYSESADITAMALTINNNAVVSIPSGKNVTLSGALKVNTGSSFTLENNAKLIQPNFSGANSGAITVKRNSAPMVRLDYTLWSSPVAAQNLFAFSPNTVTTPTARFYSYSTLTDSYDNTGITGTSSFTKGKGYAVRAPNDFTSTPTVFTGQFTGVPNNGTISIALDATSPGYNLVGNPYPSPINASTFVTANSSLIDGTLYFFSHNAKSDGTAYETSSGGTGMQYATWNSTGTAAASSNSLVTGMNNTSTPNGTIQVGQGFIVKATANGTLTFNNDMRTVTSTEANADQFFKVNNNTIGPKAVTAAIATEKHRLWLDLTNEKGEGLSQLLVGYVDGATNEVDNLFDGEEFGSPKTSLTSQLNGKSYTIQGRALPFNDTDVVPLAFKAAANGRYTIALSKTDGLFASNQEVLLKDNATGTVKDLKTGSYTFSATAGTASSRFELAYSKSAINAIDEQSALVTAVKKQGVYQISTNGASIKEIEVYDIQGNLVLKQQNIDGSSSSLVGLTAVRGVLIVKVTTQTDQVNTIKIIN